MKTDFSYRGQDVELFPLGDGNFFVVTINGTEQDDVPAMPLISAIDAAKKLIDWNEDRKRAPEFDEFFTQI